MSFIRYGKFLVIISSNFASVHSILIRQLPFSSLDPGFFIISSTLFYNFIVQVHKFFSQFSNTIKFVHCIFKFGFVFSFLEFLLASKFIMLWCSISLCTCLCLNVCHYIYNIIFRNISDLQFLPPEKFFCQNLGYFPLRKNLKLRLRLGFLWLPW